MKDHLRQLASTAENDLARTCLVREYLHARILESLQDTGAFLRWAFVGGTALRFLFSIPRFSEDLDFSLITPGKDADFRSAAVEMKRMFEREGYSIDVNVREKRTVSSAWVRFPGLLREVGISSHAAQVLSIKVELDTNPPAGAHIENSIVRKHVTLNLCHYDKASLLAGKIHSIDSGRASFGSPAIFFDRNNWPLFVGQEERIFSLVPRLPRRSAAQFIPPEKCFALSGLLDKFGKTNFHFLRDTGA